MTLIKLMLLMLATESGGDNNAIGKNGELGCLQLKPIMVREVNRIQKSQVFTLKDRSNRTMSLGMCRIYLKYQTKRYKLATGKAPTVKQLASSWKTGSIFDPLDKVYIKALGL